MSISSTGVCANNECPRKIFVYITNLQYIFPNLWYHIFILETPPQIILRIRGDPNILDVTAVLQPFSFVGGANTQ